MLPILQRSTLHRLSKAHQLRLDRLVAARGDAGAAAELLVSTALIVALGHGGYSRNAGSVRRVAEALDALGAA